MKKLKQIIALVMVVGFGIRTHAQEAKPNIIIQKVVGLDTKIEKAWQVLGPEFANAERWASTVNKSEGKGELIKGEVPSQRVCITPMGTLNETIVTYAPEDYTLSYLFEGMPKMVKSAQNTWKLTPDGEGKTKLTLTMEMRVGGIGKIMKPMMKGKMSKMAQHTVEEFKYYVETGKQHPRKVKAAKKYSKKKAKV